MKELLQRLLDEEFYGSVEVMSEELLPELPSVPDQYIVYTIIGRYPTRFSDNRPRCMIERAEVACYATSIRKKESLRKRAIKALLMGDIILDDAGYDLDLNKDSKYYGCAIDCSRTVTL